MDAVEFLKTRARMCSNSSCEKCSLKSFCESNFSEKARNAEGAVAIVEQWAKEHPVKTRQSELQKLFPDLALEDGWFCMCPKYVGQKKCIDGPLEKSTCDKCRRDFWMKEIE